MRARIAIMFDSFGPYHIARMLGAAAFADVIAVEAAPSRGEYAWDKPAVPAPLSYLPLDRGTSAAELDAKLAPLKPDTIALPGWASGPSLAALRWAHARGIPAIVMSETNGWDVARKPLTEWIKRRVVAHFSAGLVTSASQADYLGALGVPPAQVFRGYNAVDNAYFATAAAHAPMPEIDGQPLPEALRGRYFLTSNRFIEKKNLVRLLDAYAAFRQDRGDDPHDWPLVLLGDGDLREALTAKRAALGLDRHVLMPGFRQIDELPGWYGTAGAFVHASTTEQWGLVVNEAMASGLPVAISSRCGCAEVLVEDGVTGVLFDPYDTPAITAALVRLTDPQLTATLAANARGRVAEWGPERFGAGLAAAVAAARARPARPELLDRAVLRLVAARATA